MTLTSSEGEVGAGRFAAMARAPERQHANALYYGDNLDVLRRDIPTESVDLVYLDPPFPGQLGCCTLGCGCAPDRFLSDVEAGAIAA